MLKLIYKNNNQFNFSSLILLILTLLPSILAYIPAVSVNDTSGLVTSADLIHIAWLNGVFTTGLSRQLVADSFDDAGNYTTQSPLIPWSKFSKGALVHFSENFTSQYGSDVPWLALINCDTNGTVGTYSETDDIFTLARDHGAQAAVLYSLLGQGCLINQNYLQNFEKVLDVYATDSQQGARLIESQFINVGAAAYNFDSRMMNNSASVIASLLNVSSLTVFGGDIINPFYNSTPTAIIDTATSTSVSNSTSIDPSLETSTSLDFLNATIATLLNTVIITPTAMSLSTGLAKRKILPRATATTTAPPTAMTSGANYLAAVLAASNITVGGTPVSSPTPTAVISSGGPNTGLAMIILYAITGVVTFMFLIVIMAGAVRAIRHPERYGPRGGNYNNGEGGQQQSRAHGLTRAILDTFPVVKFGRSAESNSENEGINLSESGGGSSIIDNHNKSVGMNDMSHKRISNQQDYNDSIIIQNRNSDNTLDFSTPSPSGSIPLPLSDDTTPLPIPLTINPIDVEEGTCPICVCEFESGEDVRILPCHGKHRFHRDCIDPWLLKFSSLCPLCKLDLANGLKEEAEEAEAEQVVISNLRAMLQNGRGGSSNNNNSSGLASGSGGGGSGGGSGGLSMTNNRFFRYVASKRQSGRSFNGPDVPVDEE